jgi:hypothetical protein
MAGLVHFTGANLKLKEELDRSKQAVDNFVKTIKAVAKDEIKFTAPKPKHFVKAPSYYDFSLSMLENRIDELMRRKWQQGLVAYAEWSREDHEDMA